MPEAKKATQKKPTKTISVNAFLEEHPKVSYIIQGILKRLYPTHRLTAEEWEAKVTEYGGVL